MAVLAGQDVKASDIPGDGSFADVATEETTTSTSYTALATPGPATTVTLVAGQQCQVFIRCTISEAVGSSARASFAVSGAVTVAAADVDGMIIGISAVKSPGSSFALFTCTVSGSHTFTMQYRQTGGTGTYSQRRIMAIPSSV